MGFFRRLFGLERSAPDAGSMIIAKMLRSGVTPRRGTAELLAAFRENPWVRAVVGRVGNELAAATKWTLYDKPERHPKRKQIFDHPVLELLDNPNLRGGLAPQTVWAVTQYSLDLVGDGFLIKDRNASGMTVELTPAPVTRMKQTPRRGSEYFLLDTEEGQKQLKPENVIWLKDPDPADPMGRGVGTAEAAGDEIDIDGEATKQIKSFFRGGMLPGHLVMLEGAGDEEVTAFETFLKAKYSGSAGRHQTHITNKKIDVKALETSFKDMELVPLRKDQRDRFVQVYGVPPELFGILENSNRATVDAAYYLFAKAVLVPRLRLLASELQVKLIAPEYPGVYLGFESPVPEDRDFFIRSVATAPTAFFVGEVRARVGLPPSAIDGERLNTAPVVAGPTNVPPGKSLGQLLDELDARTRAQLIPGAVNGQDAMRRLEAAMRLERELNS